MTYKELQEIPAGEFVLFDGEYEVLKLGGNYDESYPDAPCFCYRSQILNDCHLCLCLSVIQAPGNLGLFYAGVIFQIVGNRSVPLAQSTDYFSHVAVAVNNTIDEFTKTDFFQELKQ